jgi:hypothetical protein
MNTVTWCQNRVENHEMGEYYARAQNRLTIICQLSEARHNTPSAQRIKPGRRLIQEEQQLWLRGVSGRSNFATCMKLTFAANSTPSVVRLRSSTPGEPIEASAYVSSPHIFRHVSTLKHTSQNLRSSGKCAWTH